MWCVQFRVVVLPDDIQEKTVLRQRSHAEENQQLVNQLLVQIVQDPQQEKRWPAIEDARILAHLPDNPRVGLRPPQLFKKLDIQPELIANADVPEQFNDDELLFRECNWSGI